MGYLVYYVGWMLVAFLMQRPPLLLGVVVFLLLRPFLPDPLVVLRTWRRMRALDAQIAANPANITARRDLAMLWLERMRPGRALQLLEEADKRDPNNPEILYLMGLAKLGSGDAEGALAPLVRSVELDSRTRFGEPYVAAGQALMKLGRFEEAEDAFERYLKVNSSSVKGYYLLGKARRGRGEAEAAKKAFAEARATFWQLPGFSKRRQIGWWSLAVMAWFWS